MNGYQETIDFLIFLGATGSAVKKSLVDDGRITTTDGLNFVDPLVKLPAAIAGITEIPAEFATTITPEVKQKMIKVVAETGLFEGNVEAKVEKGIALAIDLKNYIMDDLIAG